MNNGCNVLYSRILTYFRRQAQGLVQRIYHHHYGMGYTSSTMTHSKIILCETNFSQITPLLKIKELNHRLGISDINDDIYQIDKDTFRQGKSREEKIWICGRNYVLADSAKIKKWI